MSKLAIMKKTFTILAVFLVVARAFSQTDSTQNQTQYIFKQKPLTINNIGVYVAPEVGGIFSKNSTALRGASVMVLFNKNLAIGLSGQVAGRNYQALSRQQIMQGGFKLEYTIKPNAKIHATVPLLIGASINDHHRNFGGNNSNYKNYDKRNNINHHNAVIYSGLALEGNLNRYLKLNLGAGYQYSFSYKNDSSNTNTNNGLRATLTLKIGIFEHKVNKKDSLLLKKKK
jgi:hypothetical protein